MAREINQQSRAERLAVIENIRAAVAEGDSFRKVELSDPMITEEDIRRVIVPFDTLRRKPSSKIKAFFARKLAELMTRAVNRDTELVGMENLEGISGGAIITSNHYNPTDTTPIRMMVRQVGKGRRHNIVVQESNIFMTGLFGFLMKNCGTLPVSASAEYMTKNLKPAIEELLRREHFILIYPEQEMWFNYKKPRALRDGAYHYAALFGVPIISVFTEMRNMDGELDENGFYPVKHILHIMPPIYPDPTLSVRENRVRMQREDYLLKRKKYEQVYGIPLSEDFIPERDIAGYR